MPAGNFLRRTNVQYMGGAYTGQNVNILNLPQFTTVYSGSSPVAQTRHDYDDEPVANTPGLVGHDNANYAGGGSRGNITNHNVCLIFSSGNCSSWAGHGFCYDIAGNVVQTTDPKNNITKYSYADAYSDG